MQSQKPSTFPLSKNKKLAKSNKTWFDKYAQKNIIRRNFACNRYNRYRTPSNKTKYKKMRNHACELLRSKKREYFNAHLTRFLNSPKRFFNELNQLTARQKRRKMVSSYRGNENKPNTDNFA